MRRGVCGSARENPPRNHAMDDDGSYFSITCAEKERQSRYKARRNWPGVDLEDDGGGGQIAEPSEEEYDALNDETFGSAINGDWEEVHENLVRLNHNSSGESRAGNSTAGNGGFNSYDSQKYFSSASSASSTPAHRSSRSRRADNDLAINLSSMKLDDVDFDDNESCGGSMDTGIEMDPSVWSSYPGKVPMQMGNRNRNTLFGNANSSGGNSGTNPHYTLRDNFSSPTGFQQQRTKQEGKPNRPNSELPFFFQTAKTPKISTLEDIERNIIVQQKQQQEQLFLDEFVKQSQKTQQQPQQKLQQHHQQLEKLQQQQRQHQFEQQQHQMQKQQQKGPPGFTSQTSPRAATNNLPQQHPLANMAQQQMPNAAGGRLPPGFPMFPPGFAGHMQQPHPQIPPHPLLAQHGLPHPHQRPLSNPHLPIALNNFAMHPNFNAMRAAAAAAAIHQGVLAPPNHQGPRLPPHPMAAGPMNQTQYNMFNMRLVEEIRQNHPLLRPPLQQQPGPGMPNNQQHQNQQQRNNAGKQGHLRRDSASGNGNLPHEEYDAYANLMSTRDKHWLIGIQLSQLNTDTPYIDDFYYTIYRERKAAVTGSFRHSQAHKDNQLNHPLTQPKGHAQLILVQLGNKNGTRNGQHRERHNSESSTNQDQRAPYVYTPLKFENSLGKLQYGSVTAPRKIIDAEIMTADTIMENMENADAVGAHAAGKNATVVSASSSRGSMGESQRKSRHILLHIETLYRIVLKLEDLDNPHAITTIIWKKKKEAERIAALEQLENANKTPEERAAESSASMNPALKNKFAYEIETKEALVGKLISGLTHDKIVAMMNVRKGKALIKRIMPYIIDNDIRWQVWIGVFSSLQNVFKKDREDAERVLYALYPDFKEQIKSANFEMIVRIAASIPFDIKKLNAIFCSKFGISSLVCLILQAEHIYLSNCDATFNSSNKENWRQFLNQVATTLNRTLQSQTICAAIESDSIQPMMNHFARFQDLKLDSLLALIKEAEQQIN